MEGLRAAQEYPPEISLFDDGGSDRFHRARQYLAGRPRPCERDVDLGPRRGPSGRLPRQDPRSDASRPSKPGLLRLRAFCLARSSSSEGRRRLQERGGRPRIEPARKRSGWLRQPLSPVPRRMRRGHLVITAPTGGSAGVLPAMIYSLGRRRRSCPTRRSVKGCLPQRSIGYLCKHNATLSAAEGGCQAEIGVASAMGAARSRRRTTRRRKSPQMPQTQRWSITSG